MTALTARSSDVRNALGWVLWVLWALFLISCASSGKEDLVSRTLPITVPAGVVEKATAPRYAVVWTYGSRFSVPEEFRVTRDSKLKSSASETRNAAAPDYAIRFDLPSDATLDALPVEPLIFGRTENGEALGFQTYLPRVVVYDDLNDNQQFDLDPVDGVELEDVVLAVDGNEGLAVTAIPELREQFRALPAEAQAIYYAYTNGRLSHFVLTRGASGQRIFSRTPGKITLITGQPERLRENVRCGREVLELTSPHLLLDERLGNEADALCTLYEGYCLPIDLESLYGDAANAEPETPFDAGTAPETDSTTRNADAFETDATTAVQCRRLGNLDALVLFPQPRCSFCLCTTYTTLVLTSRQAPPSWWPCGKSVPYCTSDLALLERDPNCAVLGDESRTRD